MTKLRRYEHNGHIALGVEHGESVIDLTRAYAASLAAQGIADATPRAEQELPADALAFFDGGVETYARLTEAVTFAQAQDAAGHDVSAYIVPTASVTTLVPLPHPRKIICVARNFGKHAAEAGLAVSEIPILFSRFAATLIADGDAIEVPRVSSDVDWEGELAVVIGKRGRHLTRENAMDYVAGYTIFNDVSVRDYQFRVTQYTDGKNFATSGPIGPSITLVDEGIDPHNARITTTINGVVKQDASTEEFIFDIPAILVHISEYLHLEPGDIIPMGTPAGVGFKRTPPEFLRDGDVIDVAIEGLGVLRNPVINEQGATA